jgi:outer membrane putative beta-barrel porin/alpha-amylase
MTRKYRLSLLSEQQGNAQTLAVDSQDAYIIASALTLRDMMRIARVLLLLIAPATLQAQTIDDGALLPGRALSTGVVYAHEGWSQYWEGTLKRENGNIGTVTTQTITWTAGYGVSDRLSVMAMLPYVSTEASQGPLHGMSGVQDFMLAAKYQILATPLTDRGTLRALIVGAAGIPASNYTPDFQPLSIGLASRQLSGRFTLNFEARDGWFLNGSAGYTWRANVKLDRPAYYTNGQLYLTDEVAMPDVVDYSIGAGFQQGRVCFPVSFFQQRTLGGGDIRRQDTPFVSNRMDFARIDAMVMYRVPAPRNIGIRVGTSRIVSGRNVGQATTVTGGLFYTLHF